VTVPSTPAPLEPRSRSGAAGLLVFDPGAAAALAGRVETAGGAAGWLGRPPLADGDPWWTDPALAMVTDAVCARLLAVASEFDLVALALRSAVVFYREADDRAAARLGGLDRPGPAAGPRTGSRWPGRPATARREPRMVTYRQLGAADPAAWAGAA
jgi:hypothetical protein